MAVKRRRRYPKKHRDFLNKYRHKYDDILKSQNGGCGICGKKPSSTRKLDLDHSHKEPMVLRGALCFRCNRALREFMDKEWLLKAADYVTRNLNERNQDGS